jgi:hypothetical protein
MKKILLSVALVAATLAPLGTAEALRPPPPVPPLYDLSGTWAGGQATIQQYHGNLTVYVGRRGPFRGWFTGPYSIAVSFTDDPGCCTARITGNGEVLRWSNHSKWLKE